MTPRAFLASELTRARLKAGFKTAQSLADRIGFDRSVVAKAESGERVPSSDVLMCWCEACGLDPDVLDRFAELARDSAPIVPDWFAAALIAERDARTLRVWQPLIVPGLLQVAEYAESLFAATGIDRDRASELATARLDRQSILDSADTSVVLDESVLHRLIGSPVIMCEQLTHVAELSERANISVQVVPASTGANAGLSGGFWLAASDTTTLVMEAVADVTSETSSLTYDAARIFDLVRADALPRTSSRDLILRTANEWKTQ
jgi:transcriptional regulator with XRE-family HTH domain